jgi:ElaB/YqjD/DUF883 family membrane-anchored ribosome-binding protein
MPRAVKNGEGHGLRASCPTTFPSTSQTEAAKKHRLERENIMEKQIQKTCHDMSTLAEDARALITATADVAGEKVGEARKRLATALESGKEMYGHVREQAVEGTQAADKVLHENPYQAIGIAFGLGAIIGFLVARSGCSRSGG